VMRLPALARAVPVTVGGVVLIAGALQFTAWKAHHLACCRESPGRGHTISADAGSAWRYGQKHGLHCGYCCCGLMVILLIIGVMDLRTLVLVTAAITVERLAPAGRRVARATGYRESKYVAYGLNSPELFQNARNASQIMVRDNSVGGAVALIDDSFQ
jgi:predicted metal-binding membrane protein